MDFFERQEKARRRASWLSVYFFLAIAITIVTIYFFSVVAFQRFSGGQIVLWNPQLFVAVTGITLLIILTGSAYKTMQLSKGGSAVASTLGGRLLDPNSDQVDEIKLRNVVEEMAIASGIAVPQVFILPQEKGINAFAAGFSTNDAVIGITAGAIKHLNRDELQGVIAHEFSHILNGDMRLNLRLIGWAHGILCLAIIGRVLLRTSSSRGSSRNRKGNNPLPLIGLGLLIIGYTGVFFARLIKSAISRQREYLADAAAVQFTRNPSGLAGALKKIGGLTYGSRLESPTAEEASHLFFSNGLSRSMFSWMSTHPPLKERISLLDPAFNGQFPRIAIESEILPANVSPQKPVPSIPPLLPTQPPMLPLRAAELLASVGTLTASNLERARELKNSLPNKIALSIHDLLGAEAIIYSLILSAQNDIQSAQLRDLETLAGRAVYEETLALAPEVAALLPHQKLPLVELVIPTLRQLSPQQFESFNTTAHRLIEIDQQIDLFEFALQKMLFCHLKPHFHGTRNTLVQYYVLKPLAAECSVLLSALARVGHETEAEARHAFALGVHCLRMPDQPFQLLPLNECSIDKIDAALNRLTQAALPCKKILLEACAHTILADGKAQIAESELLRAIADSLDCPIPPLVG